MFQGLPHEYIEPQHLPKVAKHGGELADDLCEDCCVTV